MKKLLFASVFILIVGINHAQTLEKGNLVITEPISYELQPSFTDSQLMAFITNTYIPEREKIELGSKIYLLKADSDGQENGFIIVIVWESEEIYNSNRISVQDQNRERIKAYLSLNEEINNIAKLQSLDTQRWIIQ